MQIYIWKNNQQEGPFDEEQLNNLLQSGQITPADLGWREAMQEWQPLGMLYPENSAQPAAHASVRPTDMPASSAPATRPVEDPSVKCVRLHAPWPQSRFGNFALAALLTFIFCTLSELGVLGSAAFAFFVYMIIDIVRWIFLKFRLAAIDPRKTLTVSSGHKKFGFSLRRWEVCFGSVAGASLAFVLGWIAYCQLEDESDRLKQLQSENNQNLLGVVVRAADSNSEDSNGIGLLYEGLTGISHGATLQDESQSVEAEKEAAARSSKISFLTGGIFFILGGILYYRGLKAFQRRLIA